MKKIENIEHLTLDNIRDSLNCSLERAIENISEIDLFSRNVILNEALAKYIDAGDIYSAKIVHGEIKSFYDEICCENKELKELNVKDPLTGLLNRRGLEEKMVPVYSMVKRDNKSMSVLMVDVDNFKAVNDVYGHSVGDDLLKYVGNVFSKETRATDIVSRYGGEEFVLCLPSANLEGAVEVGHKINCSVREDVVLPDGKKFTVSIGAAKVDLDKSIPNDSIYKAIDSADEALYWMKNNGKDGVAYLSGDSFRKK